MTDPLFPVRPIAAHPLGRLLTIEAYRHENAWVFDDPATGLVKEPFVSGVSEMIDRLAAHIPGSQQGFKLLFSDQPFEGQQTWLEWVRADPVEGHWYRAADQGDEGWLCPALFCYFNEPPPKIFVRPEPR